MFFFMIFYTGGLSWSLTSSLISVSLLTTGLRLLPWVCCGAGLAYTAALSLLTTTGLSDFFGLDCLFIRHGCWSKIFLMRGGYGIWDCFNANWRALSMAGKFLISCAGSRLSSLGSESLPDVESPSPLFISCLFCLNSARSDWCRWYAF